MQDKDQYLHAPLKTHSAKKINIYCAADNAKESINSFIIGIEITGFLVCTNDDRIKGIKNIKNVSTKAETMETKTDLAPKINIGFGSNCINRKDKFLRGKNI